MTYIYRQFKNRTPRWKGNLAIRYPLDFVFIVDSESSTQFYMNSRDGMNFSQVDSFNLTQGIVTDVAYSADHDRFVVSMTRPDIYTQGLFVYSTSGPYNWATGSMTYASDYRSVCYSPTLQRFVAVGDEKPIWSDDGITWNAPTNVPKNGWYYVRWVEDIGKFCMINYDYSGNYFGYSVDGKTWSSVTGKSGLAFAYSNNLGRLVSVNFSFSQFAYSDDEGLNWTTITQSIATVTDLNYLSIDYSPTLDLFVAVGFGKSGTPFSTDKILVSKTGVTWSSVTIPTNVPQRVYWSSEFSQFYITPRSSLNNAQIVAYSSDGYTWATSSLIAGTTSGGGMNAIISGTRTI